MLREHDTVILKRDLGLHGLKAGAMGAIVHVWVEGTDFEVEFMTPEGRTIALVTLNAVDLRPVSVQETAKVHVVA